MSSPSSGHSDSESEFVHVDYPSNEDFSNVNKTAIQKRLKPFRNTLSEFKQKLLTWKANNNQTFPKLLFKNHDNLSVWLNQAKNFFATATPNNQINFMLAGFFRPRSLQELTFNGADYGQADIRDTILRPIPDTNPDLQFERIKRTEMLKEVVSEMLLQLGLSSAFQVAKKHLNGSSVISNYITRFQVQNYHELESFVSCIPLEHSWFLLVASCGMATDLLPIQELEEIDALVNGSIITSCAKAEKYKMNTDALLDIIMHFLSYADVLLTNNHLIRPFLANLAMTMARPVAITGDIPAN